MSTDPRWRITHDGEEPHVTLDGIEVGMDITTATIEMRGWEAVVTLELAPGTASIDVQADYATLTEPTGARGGEQDHEGASPA